MPYAIIENFAKGLDTRKIALTGLPGTLVEALDCHITNAGEIEKRKAWVSFADLGDGAIDETNLAATAGIATFGLQATSAGLTTFGSALPYGTASNPYSEPLLDAAMPTTVPPTSYQQLRHPAVQDGANYNKLLHRMTALIHSALPKGFTFALAEFADGNRYAYYNGELVRDMTDGLALAHINSVSLVGDALEAMINRTEKYTAEHPGNSTTGRVDVTGEYGSDYALTVEVDTAGSGDIAVTPWKNEVDPTPGTAAAGSIRVIGGSSGNVTALTVDGVAVIGAAVAWTTSNAATALLIAEAIKNHVSSPDYTAEALGDQVNIYATAAAGAGANGYAVSVTVTGDLILGDCPFVLHADVTQANTIMVGATDLLGGVPVAKSALTTAQFAAAIATQIRAGSGTHLYTSFASNVTVLIAKLTTSSADTGVTVTLDYNTSGSAPTEGTVTPPTTTMAVTASPTALPKAVSVAGGRLTVITTAICAGAVTGGNGTYTYEWQRFNVLTGAWAVSVETVYDSYNVPAQSDTRIHAKTPTAASTVFTGVVAEEQIAAKFRLKVTDSSTVPLVAYSPTVQVSFRGFRSP